MFAYTIRVSLFAKLVLLLLPVAQANATERWLETRIAGQPAGYVHEETESAADVVITRSESKIIINRLGSKVELVGLMRTEETLQGQAIRISAELSSSHQKTIIQGRVVDHALLLTISTGGKSYERKIILAEPLTGPDGSRRLTLQSLQKTGDRVSYSAFSPELGTIDRITRKCKARDASGIEIEESSTTMPGTSTTKLDLEGYLLRRVQASPFGDIDVEVTSREQALQAASSGAALPEESYHRSVVRSNIRLPREREIEHLRLRITHKNPALGWPDFSDSRQTVISKSKDEVILDVRRHATLHPLASPSPEFLAPNALFQSDDPAVIAIAKEVSPASDAGIFALRDWTAQHMRFDPGIAVAPASEVARDRAGTCFGYAVLLGALSRAAGMPSRMKMGFVYTGGAWGGHAWIEAVDGAQWVAVDAAMVSPRDADAARISFFSGSLAEGTIAGMGDLARMYGNVNIEILEYTLDGKLTRVPKNATPYQVKGDTYRNPWLGLTLRRPSGYSFSKLDAIWPDSTIIQLTGPNQQRVTVRQITTPQKGTTWVMEAEGPLAPQTLQKVASGLRIRTP